jgi:hypothetical protein
MPRIAIVAAQIKAKTTRRYVLMTQIHQISVAQARKHSEEHGQYNNTEVFVHLCT